MPGPFEPVRVHNSATSEGSFTVCLHSSLLLLTLYLLVLSCMQEAKRGSALPIRMVCYQVSLRRVPWKSTYGLAENLGAGATCFCRTYLILSPRPPPPISLPI